MAQKPGGAIIRGTAQIPCAARASPGRRGGPPGAPPSSCRSNSRARPLREGAGVRVGPHLGPHSLPEKGQDPTREPATVSPYPAAGKQKGSAGLRSTRSGWSLATAGSETDRQTGARENPSVSLGAVHGPGATLPAWGAAPRAQRLSSSGGFSQRVGTYSSFRLQILANPHQSPARMAWAAPARPPARAPWHGAAPGPAQSASPVPGQRGGEGPLPRGWRLPRG